MSTAIGDLSCFIRANSESSKPPVRIPAWPLLLVGGVLSSEMSLWDHLEELRGRILKSLIAVGAGTLLCGAYAPQLIEFMARSAKQAGIELIAIGSTEVFSLYLKVALAGGICLAAPFVLWQAWRFVVPALYPHEKRYAGPFLVLTTVCFVGGAVFGYAIVAPWVIKLQLLMAEQTHVIRFTPTALEYFGFLSATVVSMGLVFEMPAATLILSRIGLVSAKFLLGHFKYAFLLFSIAAGVLTPSGDLPPMLAFMAVMIVLYGISILMALIFGRRRKPAW